MPDAAPARLPETALLRELLAETSLALSSFRWRLKEAGYPFREPAGLPHLQERVDAVLFPEGYRRAVSMSRKS